MKGGICSKTTIIICEASKSLLVERTSRNDISASDLEKDLDRYMGTIGGISANVGMNKVVSDYDDIYLENEANLNDGGIIVIENGDLSVIINQNNNGENPMDDQISRGRGGVRGRSSRGRKRGNTRKEPPRKNQRPIKEILSFMSMNNSNNDTVGAICRTAVRQIIGYLSVEDRRIICYLSYWQISTSIR